MSLDTVAFGARIRATRLGYHPLPHPRDGYLRLSTIAGGVVAEFAPMSGPVPSKVVVNEYCAWWEEPDPEALLQSSPVLRAIRKVNKSFVVLLDPATGELIGRAVPQ